MEDEMFYCPKDGAVLHEHWDNTGFTPPEGAPHYEVDYYYCPICGFRIEDPEELKGNDEQDTTE